MNNQQAQAYSPAVQDYLRAIYQIGDQQPDRDRVTTSQLAERLDVKPASVTAMFQKMATSSPALIDYHKSHGAQLTEAGQTAAMRVVRSHRLLESYLYEILGFTWDEIHGEADRLEHVVSEAMLSRIAETLGQPTHDPHGHAIPAADLTLDAQPSVTPLSRLAVEQPARILYVRDEDAELLRHLDDIGLHPGVDILVIEREPPDGGLWLRVGDCDPRYLNHGSADYVFVADSDSP